MSSQSFAFNIGQLETSSADAASTMSCKWRVRGVSELLGKAILEPALLHVLRPKPLHRLVKFIDVEVATVRELAAAVAFAP
jgi:hypothetical protein